MGCRQCQPLSSTGQTTPPQTLASQYQATCPSQVEESAVTPTCNQYAEGSRVHACCKWCWADQFVVWFGSLCTLGAAWEEDSGFWTTRTFDQRKETSTFVC